MAKKSRSGGYTLIEVMVISILLGSFLVAFYEGSARMAVSTRVNQNRTEAIMQLRRYGQQWRSGLSVNGITSGNPGYFINGTTFTLDKAQSSYSATNSSLTKLSLTLGWSEPNPNSTAARKQKINDVYFKY